MIIDFNCIDLFTLAAKYFKVESFKDVCSLLEGGVFCNVLIELFVASWTLVIALGLPQRRTTRRDRDRAGYINES